MNEQSIMTDSDPAPGIAGAGGEYVRPSGMHYLRFLRRLHQACLFNWYFEVGTCTGDSLVLSRSKSIAVDPFFRVDANAIGTKPQLHTFQMGGDEFFETDFLKANKIKLDFAFLDGMHLFEYLLRDFINAEKNAKKTSVIAMHDCCPYDEAMQTRDLDNLPRGAWTGDIWKLIPILKEYRPDLKVTVLDARPTGLILVTGLNPSSKTLAGAYDEIVAKYRDMTMEAYGLEKFYSLFDFTNARDVAQDGFKIFTPASIDPDLALAQKKVST